MYKSESQLLSKHWGLRLLSVVTTLVAVTPVLLIIGLTSSYPSGWTTIGFTESINHLNQLHWQLIALSSTLLTTLVGTIVGLLNPDRDVPGWMLGFGYVAFLFGVVLVIDLLSRGSDTGRVFSYGALLVLIAHGWGFTQIRKYVYQIQVDAMFFDNYSLLRNFRSDILASKPFLFKAGVIFGRLGDPYKMSGTVVSIRKYLPRAKYLVLLGNGSFVEAFDYELTIDEKGEQISLWPEEPSVMTGEDVLSKSCQGMSPAALEKQIFVIGVELAETIVDLLNEAGFEACHSNTNEMCVPFAQTLLEVSEKPFDLVIVAYWGQVDILPELRRRWPNRKLLFLNSNSNPAVARVAEQARVDDTIVVPFQPDELVRRVKSLLYERT